MKWVEIISLRCPGNTDTRFVDELLKEVSESDLPTDTPMDLIEIKVFHHSVVETDLSIHMYWKSERRSQDKSPLGLRISSALGPLGLLNHSVWVETAAREFPQVAETPAPGRPETGYEGRPWRGWKRSKM